MLLFKACFVQNIFRTWKLFSSERCWDRTLKTMFILLIINLIECKRANTNRATLNCSFFYSIAHAVCVWHVLHDDSCSFFCKKINQLFMSFDFKFYSGSIRRKHLNFPCTKCRSLFEFVFWSLYLQSYSHYTRKKRGTIWKRQQQFTM